MQSFDNEWIQHLYIRTLSAVDVPSKKQSAGYKMTGFGLREFWTAWIQNEWVISLFPTSSTASCQIILFLDSIYPKKYHLHHLKSSLIHFFFSQIWFTFQILVLLIAILSLSDSLPLFSLFLYGHKSLKTFLQESNAVKQNEFLSAISSNSTVSHSGWD